MPTSNRWQKAQEYERAWWKAAAKRIESGVRPELIGSYRWKANQMEERLTSLFSDEKKRRAKVLEIGCGPIGIVSAITWGERYAVDPLNDFYAQQEAFARHRDPAVRYSNSKGEELKFPERDFDLAIMENVLDHVHGADRLLREIHRVLRPDGLLYMTVNIRNPFGTAFHRVLSVLRIDKGHPYSFKAASIRRFLSQHGFAIQKETIDDYLEARTKDRSSKSLKDKVKGYTGLTEFVFYAVCSKT